uniref:Uncharacterized protein n=1 Tax=Paramoeba aestuarina TaxID=180227 RepID=A0A7S4KI86_9EUKA|mmetsp:Transcript_19739/g.30877  ORF Transcript_19739/g.30877 Transcript_19739/m.30877 type:complete len:348 (+) Transcript_19739:68-1111(+)
MFSSFTTLGDLDSNELEPLKILSSSPVDTKETTYPLSIWSPPLVTLARGGDDDADDGGGAGDDGDASSPLATIPSSKPFSFVPSFPPLPRKGPPVYRSLLKTNWDDEWRPSEVWLAVEAQIALYAGGYTFPNGKTLHYGPVVDLPSQIQRVYDDQVAQHGFKEDTIPKQRTGKELLQKIEEVEECLSGFRTNINISSFPGSVREVVEESPDRIELLRTYRQRTSQKENALKRKREPTFVEKKEQVGMSEPPEKRERGACAEESNIDMEKKKEITREKMWMVLEMHKANLEFRKEFMAHNREMAQWRKEMAQIERDRQKDKQEFLLSVLATGNQDIIKFCEKELGALS